jgi:hypothetical protein
MLRQASIPSMIWAEDAICQFGCCVLVGHLFLIVPDPTAAYMCLLASGNYVEAWSTIAYHGQGLLETALCLKGPIVNNLVSCVDKEEKGWGPLSCMQTSNTPFSVQAGIDWSVNGTRLND